MSAYIDLLKEIAVEYEGDVQTMAVERLQSEGYERLDVMEPGQTFKAEDGELLTVCQTDVYNVRGVPCINVTTWNIRYLDEDDWVKVL